MPPKVSICIPTYNEPKYLGKLLETVFVQKFPDYEIVITDDTQDDSIKNIANQYGNKKLRYIKNETRLGSPENWNEAVRHAKGEYIKIMHHDTWFIDDKSLGEYVNMLDQNPHCDFAFSATLNEFSSINETKIHAADENQRTLLFDNPDVLFTGNFIGSPSAVIYRHSVKEGFDIKLQWLVDFDFYIRVLRNNRDFVFCSKPLIGETDANKNRVTNLCSNNKQIELSEYLHLFKKIHGKNENLDLYAPVLRKLFIKYNIRSIKDLDCLGIDRPEPQNYFKRLILISAFFGFKMATKSRIKKILKAFIKFNQRI
ncbi:MAG: glycosyltransferase family 2 protein [Deltaproteobacteria bacterium]|nr:glycosyltransferase family 2 protein [Deltaproteobacteria bacterium]